MDDRRLLDMARRLAAVGGVVGVTLGGSRARGTHTAGSDVDLGLYYRGALDVVALTELAAELTGAPVEVTTPGAWGPWVDGGAWLVVDGTPVDWLYRDLDRVLACRRAAEAGRFAVHPQAGHPFGVPEHAYVGEVALARVLADPTGELRELQEAARPYPPALAESGVDALGEAHLTLSGARKAVSRADTTFVAGCVFRALVLCAHALHARAGRWLVHEKGAVTAAGLLPDAPDDFAARAQAVLGSLGTDPGRLAAAVGDAEVLVDEVAAAVRRPGTP